MFSPNVGKCGPEKLRIRTHLTQCKLRTKIIQLANIILVSGRKRWSHQTTCLESCSNSLWLTIHETSSLLWMWWKFWSSTCFLQKNGFVSLRHNLVRNITLSLLIEVCEDVRVEPQLQPLTGESFNPSIATGNEVRLLHRIFLK